jgi:sulfotransferase family protein
MNENAIMRNDDKHNYKYVFVCGLHRSGTSALGRNIGELENCTGLKTTSGYMEGQLHQDVYPIDTEFGGAGRFGFDPRAHLTETSALLTPENVARLRASWHLYWDKSKMICVEKTPANLLMTRFLQAAFPNSYFIVIRRHPVPVSMSTQRLRLSGIMWNVKITSLHRLFEHWLHCYELFEQDKKYLTHLYEFTYEDYVEDPAKYHEEIAAFIGTRVPEGAAARTRGAHNRKYFDRWCYLLGNSFFMGYYRYIARKYEPRFAKYGYSLTKGFGLSEEVLREGDKASAGVGTLYCLGADACAVLQRFGTLSPKRQLKALLPEFVLARIRRVRHRALLNKGKAGIVSP